MDENNVKKVIETLLMCTDGIVQGCFRCPYRGMSECRDVLLNDSLKAVVHLRNSERKYRKIAQGMEQEIQHLKEMNEAVTKGQETLQKNLPKVIGKRVMETFKKKFLEKAGANIAGLEYVLSGEELDSIIKEVMDQDLW